MSRATVIKIRPGMMEKIVKNLKGFFNAIKKVGLPMVMDDFSMPVARLASNNQTPSLQAGSSNRMSISFLSTSPVPLSLTESLAMCGSGFSPLPDVYAAKHGLLTRDKIKAVKKVQVPSTPDKKKRIGALKPIENQSAVITAKAVDVVSEGLKEQDSKITDALVASLRQMNLNVKTEESVASNFTKITVEDIFKQNRIRIPEYVVLRRG